MALEACVDFAVFRQGCGRLIDNYQVETAEFKLVLPK
jgi:hypothetical protein